MKLFLKIPLFFYIIVIITLNLYCGSTTQFSDGAIQKDITKAVNSYNSENWQTRLQSVRSISKYSDTVYAKNSLLLMSRALDDPYSEVRIEALKNLRKMKAPAVEEKISAIALDDPNSNVRYFAFSALGDYMNKKNEKFFLQGLYDKDWLVKEAALKGLMRINDPGIQKKHIGTIINAIRGKNISIKLAAISNITIKDRLLYNELARIINNRESGLSVLKAALEKIKSYSLDEKTKNRIVELLTHRDKNVRILSLQALKQEKLDMEK